MFDKLLNNFDNENALSYGLKVLTNIELTLDMLEDYRLKDITARDACIDIVCEILQAHKTGGIYGQANK